MSSKEKPRGTTGIAINDRITWWKETGSQTGSKAGNKKKEKKTKKEKKKKREPSSDSESDYEKSKKSRKSNRSSKKSTPIKKVESPIKPNRSSRNRSRSRSESRNNRNFGGRGHVNSSRMSRNVSGPWSRTINQNSLSRSRSRDPPVRSRGRHPLDRSRSRDRSGSNGPEDRKPCVFYFSRDAKGCKWTGNECKFSHDKHDYDYWQKSGRSLPNTGLIDRTEPLRQNRRSYTPDKRRY
jgi:hypothetical protein